MDTFFASVPFALVLLCPLMMLLMMWGMRSGHGHEDHAAHESTADRDELAQLREEVVALREQVGTRR